MRRRVLLAAAPGCVAGLVAAGCGSRRTQRSAGTATAAASSDPRLGTAQAFPAATRKPPPALTGELLDGTAFDLAAWRGSLVVVNIWGSWCAPCRAEAPDLEATFQTTQDLGVRFLGIDIRDSRDGATAFVDASHITYPSLFDPAGRAVLDFRDVSPNVVPATLLLDRQLRVAAVFRRRVTGRELEAAVRALAGEGGA